MTREQKIALTGVIATVLAFAIGFLWQNARARAAQDKLDTANVELTFKRLEATLAAATIDADRGNYEIARQLASEFFTGLQTDLERAPEARRAELRRILAQRDIIITAASRSDPQTGSLLAQLYSTYRVAFGDAPVQAQPAPSAPAPTSTTSQP
jgi:hypothetical protein